MTVNVRSSSLHDITSFQRLGLAGALVASIMVVGFAIQVAPSVKLGVATPVDGATAAGIADYRAGEIALGSVLVGDKALHWGWQQARSQAVVGVAIDAGRHRPGRHPAKHPVDEGLGTHPSGLFRGR